MNARRPPRRESPATTFLVPGWILLLDGVAVFVWFLQALPALTYRAISYPAWVIGFVAEVGLALWLLIKGTNEKVPPPLPTG